MKKWYIKLDLNNIILDAIEYPVEGYTEVQLSDTQLPAGINGGWYKWDGVNYQEDSTLKPATSSDRMSQLEAQNAQVIMALVMGGLM